MNNLITLDCKVEYANETPELIELAKNKGIIIPCDHLAVFKTVYAKIEEANKNKVSLARHAVLRALPTLIGKQVNLEHYRRGFVVGAIFYAELNEKDQIEVAFTFYKDLYPEEFERAIEKLKAEELSVSFELLSSSDSQEFLEDGTRRLHDIEFTGMGFLIDSPPAYPEAKVFDLAKKVLDKLDYEYNKDLIFAKELKENCINILAENKDNNSDLNITNEKTNERGNNNMELTQEQKDLIAKLREEYGEKVQDWKDEDLLDEAKVAELNQISEESESVESSNEESKITDEETEKSENADHADQTEASQLEETENSEASEEVENTKEKNEDLEKAETTIETKVEETIKETFNDKERTSDVNTVVTQTFSENNEVIETVTVENQRKETYTIAEVDEIKAEYEKQLEELKSKIDEIQIQAELIGQRKAEFKGNPYAVDFSNEDYLDELKLENAKLKFEKDQQKIDETAKNKEDNLETGHIEKAKKSKSPLLEYLKAEFDKSISKK